MFNDIYSRIKPYDPEVYTSHRLTAVTDGVEETYR